MHELSIVMSIVEVAESQVRAHQASSVESIDLEIGNLAGVEWNALDFAWEAGVRQTVLENAERRIHRISGKARCMDCETIFEMEKIFDACPNCGQYFSDIIQGKELKIRSLVLV